MAERVRLAASHEPPPYPPIQVQPGEILRIGKLDETWPAFRWCVTEAGRGGWVPDRYLRRLSDERALVQHAYDTTELAVDAGTTVEVIQRDAASGWLWCRRDDGLGGWVPMSATTELLDTP